MKLTKSGKPDKRSGYQPTISERMKRLWQRRKQDVQQSPENEPPFMDTPLLAAKRKAFDNPTQENLDALIRAAHASECGRGDHEWIYAFTFSSKGEPPIKIDQWVPCGVEQKQSAHASDGTKRRAKILGSDLPLSEKVDALIADDKAAHASEPQKGGPCVICEQPINEFDSYGVSKNANFRYHWHCVRAESATVSAHASEPLGMTGVQAEWSDAAHAKRKAKPMSDTTQKITDKSILDWAVRHDFHRTLTDLRAAFEDAASAHASEKWTVESVKKLVGVQALRIDYTRIAKRIADAHNSTLQPAHASEQESSFNNPDPLDERPNP